MKLHILRTETGDSGTFSTWTPEPDPLTKWSGIELPWRKDIANFSCVPAGIYTAKLIDSDHFKRKVYLFQNVPHRTYVEMHPANWAGDVTKGYVSELRGCCSPGKARGVMPPPARPTDPPGTVHKPQACVIQSAIALDEIIKMADGEDLEVTIEWANEISPE